MRRALLQRRTRLSPVAPLRNRKSWRALIAVAVCMASQCVVSEPEQSFEEMLNSVQQTLAGKGLGANQGNSSGDGSGGGNTGGSGPTAKEFWISDVDSIAQSQCKFCHQSGGTAGNSGARLLFSGSAEDNHAAMQSFVTSAGGSADLVLSKITGGAGHGGGRVISAGSDQYQAFEQYFLLLDGGSAVGVDDTGDFWDGVTNEAPEVTIRRASLLLSGKVAQPAAIARAETSEEALRGELIKLMRGEGFHDFLLTGANDRLLTDGLTTTFFGIDSRGRFPALVEYLRELPENRPEESSVDKPFFTRWEAEQEFMWAVTREPVELIAHIVETDQSYKKILTADYTMVNPISSIAYRSDTDFNVEYLDEAGYLDSPKLNTFKPGKNRGYVVQDDEYGFSEDTDFGGVDSFSDYKDWPHAGVLSSHAWLYRYPSTDTNRNRARARWTYYHFLGVDIEKSAPRTTDPVALADTNNPTMNNTACTVCHERLDPLAGAYQLYGDRGHYKNQWGGLDSLPDSYKNPEWIDGEPGSSLYQEGDTWYRDMRAPGFEGQIVPEERDSLQWLAQQMADDPRFATATVKFWWPAIFGAEPLMLPEDPDGPDYEQRLRAYNAQESLVAELAQSFVAADYRLKELLADMLLSPWYRGSGVADADAAKFRAVELATVGSGRLLTPEELDRKNRAVFGRTWGQHSSAYQRTLQTELGDRNRYKIFYGGADSAVVTERNRTMSSLMSSVTEKMASDLACQAVGYDFNLPGQDRVIFDLVDRNTLPGDIALVSRQLSGKVAKETDEFREQDPVAFSAKLVGGPARFYLEDSTRGGYESLDEDRTNSDLILQSVTFKRDGQIALEVSGMDLPETEGFTADTWRSDDGERHWRGDVWKPGEGWKLHEEAWVALEVDLPAGDYTVEVQLATALWLNNANDAMNVDMSIMALENIDKTESAQKVRTQMASLYKRATNKVLPLDVTDIWVDELVVHAAERASEDWTWNQGAQCSPWQLWPENVIHDDEKRRQLFADTRGVIQGWTMIIHSILTSPAYLHD